MPANRAPARPATKVNVRPYLSPTLVFLAFDWEEGKNHADFLGFAIRRRPGYRSASPAFLFNKVTFDPPAPGAKPVSSDQAPIQKFHWWDGGLEDSDRGKTFTYEVTPVLGTGKNDLHLQTQCTGESEVTVPQFVQNQIGTYFNRAVVSSQAFSENFGRKPTGKKLDAAMAWLANGMQLAIPGFLKNQQHLDWAVYHLTDMEWVLPALEKFPGSASIVYYLKLPPKNSKAKQPSEDLVNREAIKLLKSERFSFHPRTKTNIMHDKFIVRKSGGVAKSVLMGSANFTPEGLTEQANLIHTFESEALAGLYSKRQELLSHDPSKKDTATGAAWSGTIPIGDAKVRVFFPPEPSHQTKGQKKPGVSMQTVVAAIKKAKKSALFCLFEPTDKDMLESLFALGDNHKMMFGLVNSISDPSGTKAKTPEEAVKAPSASAKVKVELFHRSRKDHLVMSYDLFNEPTAPRGWLPEFSSIDLSSKAAGGSPTIQPSGKSKKKFVPAVHIHHKFIVIDAETRSPTIFSGSANMSNNSVFNNDENLLEISGSPRLAQIYLAEFMRLYEHYRARALWDQSHSGKPAPKGKQTQGANDTFVLKTNMKDWVKDAYDLKSPASIMRVQLAAPFKSKN